MRSSYFLFLFLLYSLINLNAQQVQQNLLCTAGEIYETDKYVLEFSVGEIATETFATQNIQITQGFLQPDSDTTGLKAKNWDSIFANLYPNPASTEIFIELENLSYLLPINMNIIDINGKTICNMDLKEELNEISIANFKAGVYMVKIGDQKQQQNKTIIFQKK